MPNPKRSEAMKAASKRRLEKERKIKERLLDRAGQLNATAEFIISRDDGLPPPTPAEVAKATGVGITTAQRNMMELGTHLRVNFAHARQKILANLEEIDADAKADRDHSARVRANLGTAKVLGLDRPPMLTVDEQRAGWADFLATINTVIERRWPGTPEQLDEFRDDLRQTLAAMMGPQGP
jgi:hypothetical protein